MGPLGGATIKFINEALGRETDDCIIWPFSLNKRGYPQAKDSVSQYSPHRRVCERAHGAPPTPKHHAAHLCGNRTCINKRHLAWATPKENESHKNFHGSVKRSGSRTLSDSQVRDIRARFARGDLMIDLATDYGISNVAISKIVRWRTYRDVSA